MILIAFAEDIEHYEKIAIIGSLLKWAFQLQMLSVRYSVPFTTAMSRQFFCCANGVH